MKSIGDYALLADCHGAALVARDGSIEWCCMPRFDSGAMFARLLDPRAGACTVEIDGGRTGDRRYLDGTLVLETALHAPDGEARLLDAMTLEDPLSPAPGHRALLRIVEGVRGSVTVRMRVSPRFDYGEVTPWLRDRGRGVFTATGGDDGLLCLGGPELALGGDDDLVLEATLRAGERMRLLLAFRRPQELDDVPREAPDLAALDSALDATIAGWREWSRRTRHPELAGDGVHRSALVLKALTYAPTGAMVAAPTTSLPEAPGDRDEGRTWDYRYAWIRDAVLATHCLTELGHDDEAQAFGRFVERSGAGRPAELRVCYGVGGERRLSERSLDHLRGYGDAGPVRIGNAAGAQLQLDSYGHLLEQSWTWAQFGRPPDDDQWRFELRLVEAAAERWREPDRGIWEWRKRPRHFVHSKVMCWVALDRGIKLAEKSLRRAPLRRWKATRDEIRDTVLAEGYDTRRATFLQAFGAPELDAAALRLPSYGFVAYDDDRMLGTVAALQAALDRDGLLARYDADDGLPPEGAFLACTFWLVECLSGQGRVDEARAAYDRALRTANDLGLYAEEADPSTGELLGNFPLLLTHVSHIHSALALHEATEAARPSISEAPRSAPSGR
jgi:GH15 family glucan-1,4-alpha-glucosidase